MCIIIFFITFAFESICGKLLYTLQLSAVHPLLNKW